MFYLDSYLTVGYSRAMQKFKRGLPGLKKIRTLRRLSQNGLASALGLTPMHIYKLESGRSDASQKLLTELAEKLDCKVDELLAEGSEQPESGPDSQEVA